MHLFSYGSLINWILAAVSVYLLFQVVWTKWVIQFWQRSQDSFAVEAVAVTKDRIPRLLKIFLKRYESEICEHGYSYFTSRRKSSSVQGSFFHVIFRSADHTTVVALTYYQPSLEQRALGLLSFARSAFSMGTFVLNAETYYSNGDLVCTMTMDGGESPSWIHAKYLPTDATIAALLREHMSLRASLSESSVREPVVICSEEKYDEIQSQIRKRLAMQGQREFKQFVEEREWE